MTGIPDPIVIAWCLFMALAVSFIVEDIVLNRGRQRPARFWTPQARDNKRAYWRRCDMGRVDRQPAVIDAVAIVREAEQRLIP